MYTNRKIRAVQKGLFGNLGENPVAAPLKRFKNPFFVGIISTYTSIVRLPVIFLTKPLENRVEIYYNDMWLCRQL